MGVNNLHRKWHEMHRVATNHFMTLPTWKTVAFFLEEGHLGFQFFFNYERQIYL